MGKGRGLAIGLVAGIAIALLTNRRAEVARHARRVSDAVQRQALSQLASLSPVPVAEQAPGNGESTVEFPDAELIRACVHCGLCLPYCPTYDVLKLEADSPRGRIYQMKLVTEGKIDAADPHFRQHMFQCLDCRACETACPSGVQYGRLIEAARSIIPPENATERAVRRVILGGVLTTRPLLAATGIATRLYQRSGLQRAVRRSGLLGVAGGLKRMEAMLPEMQGPVFAKPLPTFVQAQGERRCRVAFLSGCVADQFYRETNHCTIAVLAANGCEVVTPPEQGCCGALQNHSGDRDTARALARHNIEVFERARPDYVVANAAGCGSMMKEYGALLRDDPAFSERARVFSARVRDVTELLAELGLRPPTHPVRRRVTYQDACHLAHGQKVKDAPRELLKAVPGLELVEMRHSDWCCGSAGIYNVTQPELSERILARKMENVAATGADMVVASNPGCLIQIEHGLRDRGLKMRTAHPIELLAEAYGLAAGGDPATKVAG